MTAATKRVRLRTFGGLAPEVWESAGINLGDWIEISTSAPGQVVIRLAQEAASLQDGAQAIDWTPYPLAEALALFRIVEPLDGAKDAYPCRPD